MYKAVNDTIAHAAQFPQLKNLAFAGDFNLFDSRTTDTEVTYGYTLSCAYNGIPVEFFVGMSINQEKSQGYSFFVWIKDQYASYFPSDAGKNFERLSKQKGHSYIALEANLNNQLFDGNTTPSQKEKIMGDFLAEVLKAVK
jgi:hypothetical protein